MTAGWTVPGFSPIRELATGASGPVVLAVDEATRTQVAIRYISDRFRADAAFVSRFRGEARVLEHLEDDNLVDFYAYVEETGGSAIVMELVDGVSLRRVLATQGPTGPLAAMTVFGGSLLALAAAHGAGLVHRAYKPENVLIRRDGLAKVSDLGLLVEAGGSIGAASYLAPELWSGALPSVSSDLYAATAVFFECLTGHPPYSARKPADLARAHQSAPIPVDEVPGPLQALIAHGLAKSTTERPTSAADLLGELDDAAAAAYGSSWEGQGRDRLAEMAAAAERAPDPQPERRRGRATRTKTTAAFAGQAGTTEETAYAAPGRGAGGRAKGRGDAYAGPGQGTSGAGGKAAFAEPGQGTSAIGTSGRGEETAFAGPGQGASATGASGTRGEAAFAGPGQDASASGDEGGEAAFSQESQGGRAGSSSAAGGTAEGRGGRGSIGLADYARGVEGSREAGGPAGRTRRRVVIGTALAAGAAVAAGIAIVVVASDGGGGPAAATDQSPTPSSPAVSSDGNTAEPVTAGSVLDRVTTALGTAPAASFTYKGPSSTGAAIQAAGAFRYAAKTAGSYDLTVSSPGDKKAGKPTRTVVIGNIAYVASGGRYKKVPAARAAGAKADPPHVYAALAANARWATTPAGVLGLLRIAGPDFQAAGSTYSGTASLADLGKQDIVAPFYSGFDSGKYSLSYTLRLDGDDLPERLDLRLTPTGGNAGAIVLHTTYTHWNRKTTITAPH